MNIDEMENLRKKLRIAREAVCVLTVVLFLLAMAIYICMEEESNSLVKAIFGLAFIIFVICDLLCFSFVKNKNDEYATAFKEYFVVNALQEFFTDLHYEPNGGLPPSVIASTNMMNMGARYSSNDYISAKYKGISFEQADVCIEEEYHDSDNGSSYYTIFQGKWLVFDFNKTFKANVQVCEKGFKSARVQRFIRNEEKSYKKVNMESEEFNKKFNVYAQNEYDAFYILTPSMMEKIQKIERNNEGKILFCFIDNKLHIGLYNGKESFEPGKISKSIDETKARNEVINDIKTITQFVDELNLDNDIFKKEE